jgi:hypothetical protein
MGKTASAFIKNYIVQSWLTRSLANMQKVEKDTEDEFNARLELYRIYRREFVRTQGYLGYTRFVDFFLESPINGEDRSRIEAIQSLIGVSEEILLDAHTISVLREWSSDNIVESKVANYKIRNRQFLLDRIEELKKLPDCDGIEIARALQKTV